MVGVTRPVAALTRDLAPRAGDRVLRPSQPNGKHLNTVRSVIAHWPALQLAALRPESGGLWEVEIDGVRKPLITISVVYQGNINGLACWLEVAGR